jgi:HK97 family phage major capsid protein
MKKIKTGIFQRSYELRSSDVNEESREVQIAFSSEEGVERWFGNEVLDHSQPSVRLGRLNDGGPLLVDHDPTDHVGTVESASVGDDRVGRAVVRFGRSERAIEIFNDVVDGIRKHISVGYRIHKMQPEEEVENSFRAVDWEPYEVSLVSIPADASVGVGRDASNEFETEIETLNEEPVMTEEVKAEAAPVVDVIAERDAIRKEEMGRIKGIEALGAMHSEQGMAREFISEGKGVDAFRAALLDQIKDRPEVERPEIGMNEKEVRNFSFFRAINALANPTDRRAQDAAGFEFEASAATADKVGREPTGFFVPEDVLRAKRDLTQGTATAGGHTVSTDLLSESFIDKLDNSMAVVAAGATVLRDLNGNVAIPRATGGATAYWVAESANITESAQAFDQVTMSPNTVGAFTEISRKLLLQSSIDVEGFVRNDLAIRLALAIDNKALEGDGSSNTPTGVINATGVGSVAFASATAGAATWGEIVDVETEVSQDNALLGRLAYLTNAAEAGYLKQTVKASGQPIYMMAGGEMNGYPVIVTNNLSTSGQILFGNWGDLIIGYWGGLDINIDTSTGSASGTLRIVALQDVDVAVRHGESFAKGV